MSSSPNDFFSSFEAPGTGGTAQRRNKPKPTPPPPPRQQRPTGGTGPSYYGSGSNTTSTTNTTSQSTSIRSRAPPAVGTFPTTTKTATSTGSTTATASNPYATPSYYGTGTTAAAAASSMTANPPAPAASAASSSTTPTAAAAAAATTDWYTAPSASTTSTTTTTTSTSASPTAAANIASPHVMNPYATSAYDATNNNNNNMTSMTSTPAAASLEGSMDTGGFNSTAALSASSSNIPQPSMFVPSVASYSSNTNNSYYDTDDFDNEPPLLEELGINLSHIWLKTKAVVIPSKRWGGGALLDPAVIVEDADLAGPLAFALLLGCELLLTVKLSFGYIYGFGLAGCLSMTLILNLMSPTQPVHFWTVTSILGYGLLPVNVLAALKIVVQNLAGQVWLARVLALVTVAWSTTASTRLLEVGCGMTNQRYLMAYPIMLLYTAFVLITIF